VSLCLTILMLVLVWHAPAAAQRARPGTTRRSALPFSRKGAEIYVEIPRFSAPLGDAYENGAAIGGDHEADIAISNGLGFGFGISFGFTDNIALEGRIVQTNHEVAATEEDWDLDVAVVGARYTFFNDGRLQPFVGVGLVRHALEWDPGESGAGEFVRLTGIGWGASAGADYFVSSRFILSARVEHAWVGYNLSQVGIDETSLEDPLNGNCVSVSLALGYRVPTW
jgi:outer membrane protein W